jgi:hypothetical protein
VNQDSILAVLKENSQDTYPLNHMLKLAVIACVIKILPICSSGILKKKFSSEEKDRLLNNYDSI